MVRARFVSLALVGALAPSLAGCGGGGDASETTLTFSPSTDLTLVSDGSAGGSGLSVGDTASNLSTRAGVRFGLFPFLPASAAVTSAKLRFQQTSVQGSPYGLLGTIVVDRVTFGLSLDASDFGATVLNPNVGTLSTTAALGLKEVDVTAAVQADVAAQALTSDFVLRFTTAVASNATADFARFEDSENSQASGVTPVLVVVYH